MSKTAMSYEDYLNEVTTVMYELYDIDEDEAVRLVVAAQDAEYFVPHDENAALRMEECAETDAVAIFEARKSYQ